MTATVSGGADDRRVDAVALQALIASLFRGVGTSDADADLIAEIAVATDLRGAYSHGSAMVPGYLEKMIAKQIDPRGRPEVVRDSGATLLIDGGNSLGHVGLAFATERVIERAKSTGIAAASLRGSNHCGAMGQYAMRALAHDMIGLASPNGIPLMAWPGSLTRSLMLSATGIAIPADQEPPIVIDFSFGAAVRSKVLIHHQKGLPLPDGWAFDRAGAPTNDPAEALAGLIQPAGGYKGASMALFFGILSALLADAPFGPELGNTDTGATPGADSQFVMAINVASFVDPSHFKTRVDNVVRQIRAGPRVAGVERIYLPGERALETERRYRIEGVPVTNDTWRGLLAVAEKVGVDPVAVQ